MKDNPYLEDIARLALENNLEAYKSSAKYSHALKNRAIYWATSLMMIVLIISLIAQNYLLEIWATILIFALILLGFNQYLFRKSRKVIYAVQENQLPRISAKSHKTNYEGLRLFVLMSGLLDAMKVELNVVRWATLVLWSPLLLIILYANVWSVLFVLIASAYAAPALVSMIYGTMTMYNLKKMSHLNEIKGFSND